jgi:hypothetical protein
MRGGSGSLGHNLAWSHIDVIYEKQAASVFNRKLFIHEHPLPHS